MTGVWRGGSADSTSRTVATCAPGTDGQASHTGAPQPAVAFFGSPSYYYLKNKKRKLKIFLTISKTFKFSYYYYYYYRLYYCRPTVLLG